MRFFESETIQRWDDLYDEERFWPRFKCRVSTKLSDDSGKKWDCDIIDVSESGFGIITGARLKRGKTVRIDVEPGVNASVIWVRNNKAGLMIND